MHSVRTDVLRFSTLLILLGAPGCRLIQGQSSPAAPPPAHATRPTALTLGWPVDAAKAPPKPASVGVVVCEPIVRAADASQAAFGSGCTRWLQLQVGGQGELAQSPTWTAIDRARVEMKLRDLRVDLDETPGVAQRTGADHCVVGEISGNEQSGALLLAIADVSAKRLVGGPLSLKGTRREILRALPGAARQIASRLGVASPVIPAAVGSSDAELEFLGGLPWLPGKSLPESSKSRLAALAVHSPLAAILALSAFDYRDRERFNGLAHSLVANAPGNTATFGALAYLYARGCTSEGAALDVLRSRYKGNYQLTVAQVMRFRGADPAREQEAAAELLRVAPRNPEAWLSAGYTASSQADQIRKGRFYSKISGSDSARLGPIYSEWLADVKKATELDPDFAHAWARLACAATFAGDYELADTALWKALKLNPAEKDALEWGIQMYQPKWGGDHVKLLDVAYRAADAWNWDSRVYGVAREIEAGGQPMEARRMRSEALKRERAAAAGSPNDFTAQSEFALGLKESGRFGEADSAFRRLLKRFPRESALNGGYHEELGLCVLELGRKSEAVEELKLADRMSPHTYRILRELAYAYRINVQPLKAMELYREALRIDDGSGNTWGLLADACLDARKMDEAVTAYRRALDLDPTQAICWRNLSVALGQTGKYDEAIGAAEHSLQLDASDIEAHQSLAYLYGKTHQFEKSVDEARAVLQRQPDSAVAHSNLGEALNDLHKRAEARREWQTALRLDPKGPNGKNAQEMLAKNP